MPTTPVQLCLPNGASCSNCGDPRTDFVSSAEHEISNLAGVSRGWNQTQGRRHPRAASWSFLSFIYFFSLLPLFIDWIGRAASVLSWRANTAGSKASLHQDQHSRCHRDFYLFFPVGRHCLVSERHTTELRGSQSLHASPLFVSKISSFPFVAAFCIDLRSRDK